MMNKFRGKMVELNEETLSYGSLLWLKLAHPQKANCLSQGMIEELSAAMDVANGLSNARAMLLYGSGKHFCAGADIASMAEMNVDASVREDAKRLDDLLYKLDSYKLPMIGLVRGNVFGGGVGLVALCDYVLAVETSVLSLSEAKLGLIPSMIMPYLQRKISAGNLSRLAISATRIGGAEAKRLGLVQECFAEGDFLRGVEAEINAILENSPAALKRVKSLMRRLPELVDKHETVQREISEARLSEDGRHGLMSFVEKRPPRWKASYQLKHDLFGV